MRPVRPNPYVYTRGRWRSRGAFYCIQREGQTVREFARDFYLSKEWRRARAYIFNRDAGLCVRCGAPGEIVHHKTHLTPENISDPEIALGEDNLETLCRDCHALAHATDSPIDGALMFDEDGNVVERVLLS